MCLLADVDSHWIGKFQIDLSDESDDEFPDDNTSSFDSPEVKLAQINGEFTPKEGEETTTKSLVFERNFRDLSYTSTDIRRSP